MTTITDRYGIVWDVEPATTPHGNRWATDRATGYRTLLMPSDLVAA